MANFNAHATGGFLAPLALVILYFLRFGLIPPLIDSNAAILLLSALIGLICGLLPDTLEPPTNPRHRGVFHYFVGTLCFAGLAITLIDVTSFQSWLTDASKFLFLSAVAGYASHFALDIF
jgi:membrane-bound metal-dependent hydrolase YbcI (DUF457 family)